LPKLHLALSIKAAASKAATNVKDAHVETQLCGLVKHLQADRLEHEHDRNMRIAEIV